MQSLKVLEKFIDEQIIEFMVHKGKGVNYKLREFRAAVVGYVKYDPILATYLDTADIIFTKELPLSNRIPHKVLHDLIGKEIEDSYIHDITWMANETEENDLYIELRQIKKKK